MKYHGSVERVVVGKQLRSQLAAKLFFNVQINDSGSSHLYRYSIKSRLSINTREILFYLSPTISSRVSISEQFTFFSVFRKITKHSELVAPWRQITSLYFEQKSNDENDTLNASFLFCCVFFFVILWFFLSFFYLLFNRESCLKIWLFLNIQDEWNSITNRLSNSIG